MIIHPLTSQKLDKWVATVNDFAFGEWPAIGGNLYKKGYCLLFFYSLFSHSEKFQFLPKAPCGKGMTF